MKESKTVRDSCNMEMHLLVAVSLKCGYRVAAAERG